MMGRPVRNSEAIWRWHRAIQAVICIYLLRLRRNAGVNEHKDIVQVPPKTPLKEATRRWHRAIRFIICIHRLCRRIAQNPSKEAAIRRWHRAIRFIIFIQRLRRNAELHKHENQNKEAFRLHFIQRRHQNAAPPFNKEKIRGQSIFEAVGVETAPNIKHRSASPNFVRRVDYIERAGVGVAEAPHHSSTAKYLTGVLGTAKQKIEVSKSTALFFFTDCLAHALSVSNVIKELPGIVEAIFISLLDEHILLQVMFYPVFIREDKIREALEVAVIRGAASIDKISVHIEGIKVTGCPKSVEYFLRRVCRVMRAEVAFRDGAEIALAGIQYNSEQSFTEVKRNASFSCSCQMPSNYGSGSGRGGPFSVHNPCQTIYPWRTGETSFQVLPSFQPSSSVLMPRHHVLVGQPPAWFSPVFNISNQVPSPFGPDTAVGGPYTLQSTGQNINGSGAQSIGDAIYQSKICNILDFRF